MKAMTQRIVIAFFIAIAIYTNFTVHNVFAAVDCSVPASIVNQDDKVTINL